ncbi:unnamed protein product [Sphagnum balticum]
MTKRGNGDDVVSVDEEENGGSEKEATTTQAVQVAVNIRPLIAMERVQGCSDCIAIVPGEPQVQIGHHSFTFDYVFGSSALPLDSIFDKCVKPLVEGLFHGYNATVLAYGQTGSGKTYTMGTGYTVRGNTEGVISQVMDTIFNRVETLKQEADFQLRVSFIEILKEEVHDLLDLNPSPADYGYMGGTMGSAFGGGMKVLGSGKPPIQIRETISGGITLSGVTEVNVKSLEEMASCLERGSLCRATGSTNMNSQSSRSHAIFTITLEQRRKWDKLDDCGEEYLCAKLHLVDLAGSERAKRTGSDGARFKEGVHINKGLLALGNVISALGDDKKRRDGGHVPYRDSKLTRLLQDSLGGNSRTVMIACVSPADSNTEETLNTLKYANRARNIQNKPMVNRDPMAAEMQQMRQQLELMQAELLCARAGGPSSTEVQVMKQKIAWLEASNMDLRKELVEARGQLESLAQTAVHSQVERDKLKLKLEKLRAGKTFEELDGDVDGQTGSLLKDYVTRIQELECELLQIQNSRFPSVQSSRPVSSHFSGSFGDSASGLDFETTHVDGRIFLPAGDPSGETETVVVAKENLCKQLRELTIRLQKKEAEMKIFQSFDPVYLRLQYERKLEELEEEKQSLQGERDRLIANLETLANAADGSMQIIQQTRLQKWKQLEPHIQSDHKTFSRQYGRKQITAACLLTGLLQISVALSSPLLSLGADRLEKEAGELV